MNKRLLQLNKNNGLIGVILLTQCYVLMLFLSMIGWLSLGLLSNHSGLLFKQLSPELSKQITWKSSELQWIHGRLVLKLDSVLFNSKDLKAQGAFDQMVLSLDSWDSLRNHRIKFSHIALHSGYVDVRLMASSFNMNQDAQSFSVRMLKQFDFKVVDLSNIQLKTHSDGILSIHKMNLRSDQYHYLMRLKGTFKAQHALMFSLYMDLKSLDSGVFKLNELSAEVHHDRPRFNFKHSSLKAQCIDYQFKAYQKNRDVYLRGFLTVHDLADEKVLWVHQAKVPFELHWLKYNTFKLKALLNQDTQLNWTHTLNQDEANVHHLNHHTFIVYFNRLNQLFNHPSRFSLSFIKASVHFPIIQLKGDFLKGYLDEIRGEFKSDVWHHAPHRIRNLSGHFLMRSDSGWIQFDKPMALTLMPLNNLHVQEWQTQQPFDLIWHVKHQRYQIHLKIPQMCHLRECVGLEAMGLISLDPTLESQIDLKFKTLKGQSLSWAWIRPWLPLKGHAVRWIKHIQSGDVSRAQLILKQFNIKTNAFNHFDFRGQINHLKLGKSSFGIPSMVSGAAHINEKFLDLDQGAIQLEGMHAPIKFDLKLDHVNQNDQPLRLSSTAVLDAARLKELLNLKFIYNASKFFQGIRLGQDGNVHVTFNAQIFRSARPMKYEFKFDLKSLDLSWGALMHLSKLSGQLFLTQDALYSKNLSARLNHQLIHLILKTHHHINRQITLMMQAHIALQDWLHGYILKGDQIQGQSLWVLNLEHVWGHWGQPWRLNLYSNLKGSLIKINHLIQKSMRVEMPVRLSGQWSQNVQQYKAHIAHLLDLNVYFNQTGLEAGYLNVSHDESELKPVPYLKNQWVMKIHLPDLPKGLEGLIHQFHQDHHALIPSIQFDLMFDHLTLNHQSWGDAFRVMGIKNHSKSTFFVKSDYISGQFERSAQMPDWNVHLNYLELFISRLNISPSATSLIKSLSAHFDIDVLKINDISMRNISFYLKKTRLGEWLIQSFKQKSAHAQIQLNASLSRKKHYQFNMNGDIHLNQITHFKDLEAGQAILKFKLSSICDHVLDLFKYLKGSGQLVIQDGRWILHDSSLESNVGLSRLLTALSLNALQHRLSLNFNDWLESGFHFDRLSADWALAQQIVYFDHIKVKNNSADIHAKGYLNLFNDQINAAVSIQPKLTASLPVLTALAIHPPAGALVWLADHFVLRHLPKIDYFKISGLIFNPVVQSINQPVSMVER